MNITQHARNEAKNDALVLDDIFFVACHGEIIEDYPDDKYGPSCLILGYTKAGRPLHLQCSYSGHPPMKIITLYEPSADRWIDFRIRK